MTERRIETRELSPSSKVVGRDVIELPLASMELDEELVRELSGYSTRIETINFLTH